MQILDQDGIIQYLYEPAGTSTGQFLEVSE